MPYQAVKGGCKIVHIKERREQLGISQVNLATMVGVTQGAISMIERGDRTPSLDVLMKIADVLNCTIDELIIRKDESA